MFYSNFIQKQIQLAKDAAEKLKRMRLCKGKLHFMIAKKAKSKPKPKVKAKTVTKSKVVAKPKPKKKTVKSKAKKA